MFEDPVMTALHHQVISQFGELQILKNTPTDQYFWSMCASIIGQQLSEKVAPQIEARVRKVLQDTLTPEQVLLTPDDDLRAAGLSYSKISYLKNVAGFWQSSKLSLDDFTTMENENLITHLTQIKGVGRWTVEMFLIFTLGRPDVFSAGDYGLKRAVIRAYALPENISPKELTALASSWSPNRSLASRVLWKSLELPAK
jgi:DNA-3-methyladenine glycosylase II